MPSSSRAQVQFNAGELAPELYGRADLDQFRQGVRRLENFIPLRTGPARRRPGTRFIASLRGEAQAPRLVPFQFSVHIEEADGAVTHHEFLRLDGADPRRSCAEALMAAIPTGATIIAYNAPFEKGVLRELAAIFPDLQDGLLNIAQRTVDLLPVTRNHWYHRDQRGSWSIKAVLPTMTSLEYSILEVKDGAGAQEAYLEAIRPDTSDKQRTFLSDGLKKYCAQDTWAMVAMARFLSAAG